MGSTKLVASHVRGNGPWSPFCFFSPSPPGLRAECIIPILWTRNLMLRVAGLPGHGECHVQRPGWFLSDLGLLRL